jgi:hypothetical protein
MPTYRRRKGSDVWHWCRNRSNWPTSDYDEVTTRDRPSSGELDNQCRRLERDGDCRSS